MRPLLSSIFGPDGGEPGTHHRRRGLHYIRLVHPAGVRCVLLAKLTHAPNAFIVGYSGVDPLPFQLTFHFRGGLHSRTRRGLVYDGVHRGAALAGQWAMWRPSPARSLDANGDINISWLAMPVKDAEGKPTGQMNPPALRLPGRRGRTGAVYGLHRKGVAYFAVTRNKPLSPGLSLAQGSGTKEPKARGCALTP